MALFIVLMVVGCVCVDNEDGSQVHSLKAIIPLLGAVLIRSGIAPFHCWMTDLFEHATFGTALLFVTPTAGAYAAVRLVLPIAPDWVLRSMGLISLVTAVYAAAMSLVQRDARRFFCYLFLSHSALVLVGLEMVTPSGLTGALCVWLSAGVALGGFGLTLRALEARRGRLSLVEFQGMYEHTPNLAMLFMLTGLASVGFPGHVRFRRHRVARRRRGRSLSACRHRGRRRRRAQRHRRGARLLLAVHRHALYFDRLAADRHARADRGAERSPR